MKRQRIVLAVALAAVIGGAGAWYGLRQAGTTIPRAELEWVDNPEHWDDSAASIPVSSADPVWGARDAPVTVVVFSDFQCPFCGKVEPTINTAQKEYGPHKLRVVWKHFPLAIHPKAMPAHLAAETVFQLGGSRAFWVFHDRAFDHQKELDFDGFGQWAKASGVEMDAFFRDFKDKKWSAEVRKDLKLGDDLGVRSTPSLFVNGILLKGAAEPAALRELIDKELAEADALVKGGTPADQVYVARCNANHPKDAPKEKKKKKGKDEEEVFTVSLGSAPRRGPDDALVTIVEFGDFACPYTRELEPALRDVLARHPADVRLVWRDRPLPVHPAALPAALLSQAARGEADSVAFWKLHDAMLATEEPIQPGGLGALASAAGLGAERVGAILRDAKPDTPAFDPGPDAALLVQKLAEDEAAADDLAVSGTPHLFVNGVAFVGRPSAAELESLVGRELVKAEALLKAGTPRDGIWKAVMANASPAEPLERTTIDPAPEGAPARGPDGAKVELHVFGDFECPFSKRAEPTLQQLIKRHGDDVRVVWRDRPLSMHKNALLAAQAAREALAQKGPDGFWAYHDALFEAQGARALDRAGLSAIAKEQGLDAPKLEAALADGRWAEGAKAAAKQADDYGITGTPTFVFTFGKEGDKLTGFTLSGAQGYSKFTRALRLALRLAQSPGGT